MQLYHGCEPFPPTTFLSICIQTIITVEILRILAPLQLYFYASFSCFTFPNNFKPRTVGALRCMQAFGAHIDVSLSLPLLRLPFLEFIILAWICVIKLLKVIPFEWALRWMGTEHVMRKIYGLSGWFFPRIREIFNHFLLLFTLWLRLSFEKSGNVVASLVLFRLG